MSKEFDAVIVLAYATGEDTISDESAERTKIGVEVFNTYGAEAMIMCGLKAFLDRRNPKIAQAELMKNHAVDLGVPKDLVVAQSQSLDTIGDLYFAKRITEIMKWRKLALVTTGSHLERGMEAADYVMGPDYEVTGFASPEPEKRRGKQLQELGGLIIAKAVFSGIEAGDDEAIGERLFKLIPGYTDASLAQIARNWVLNGAQAARTLAFSK